MRSFMFWDKIQSDGRKLFYRCWNELPFLIYFEILKKLFKKVVSGRLSQQDHAEGTKGAEGT